MRAPFKRFKNGLLPALCLVAAVTAAVLTVKADSDSPGSSVSAESGMGNSYEYPNGANKHKSPAEKAQPSGRPSPKAKTSPTPQDG